MDTRLSSGADNAGQLVRPRYFPRQVVTAADLATDQEYVRERLRRHNRYLHGCGVVCGLLAGIQENTKGEQRLLLGAGAAIDRDGNDIVVPADVSVPVTDLCWAASTAAGRVRAKWPPREIDPCENPGRDSRYYLALCYQETPLNPRPIAPDRCSSPTVCEPSRLQDGYEVVLLDDIAEQDCALRAAEADDPYWLGDYYSMTSLPSDPAQIQFPSAPPTLTRFDAAIDFAWGADAPAEGVNADNFMVRWRRSVYFPSGAYHFTVTADDGVRLYVDGRRVLDEWRAQPATAFTADVGIQAGNHDIMLEYFERAGAATVRLKWEVTQLGWYAEYYQMGVWTGEAPDFPAGPPTATRLDRDVNFNWGASPPIAGVRADHFMARWTRDLNIFAAGEYELLLSTSGGVRVWVDDQQVLDQWHGRTTPTVARAMLDVGRHRLRIEYYNAGAAAAVSLRWGWARPYNPPCSAATGGGCVILASVVVTNGRLAALDNFWFDKSRGYRRQLASNVEIGPGRIAQLVPGSGVQGTSVAGIVVGRGLGEALAITVSGDGVTGNILPGGTDTWAPVQIVVGANATPGRRSFQIATPWGVLDSQAYDVAFEIVAALAVGAPPTTSPVTHVITRIIGNPITFVVQPVTGPIMAPITNIIGMGPPGPIIDPGPVINPGPDINPGGVINPGLTVGPDIGLPRELRPAEPSLGAGPSGTEPTTPVSPPAPISERPVDEVGGIGRVLSARLAQQGVRTLADLAALEPVQLAQSLDISLIRATRFIDEARRRLEQ